MRQLTWTCAAPLLLLLAAPAATWAADPAPPPAAKSSDLPLVLASTVMGTPPDAIPGMLHADTRFARLDWDGRARLLSTLEAREDTRATGFVLNCLLPFAIGSFYQGDPAAPWLLGFQLGSLAISSFCGNFGLQLNIFGDSVRENLRGVFIAGIIVGLVGFVAMQIVNVAFALKFKGARYGLVKKFFDEAPAPQVGGSGVRFDPTAMAIRF
jgi:hypothetical protein